MSSSILLLRHQRLERPERQRDEHDVEDDQHRRSTSSPSARPAAAPSSAAVPRTPAMMTGIVIGYNRIGSSTSRVRARTSIAANSVPTAAEPDRAARPAAPRSSSGRLKSGAWNSSATSGTSSSFGDAEQRERCRAACRRRSPAAAPAPAAARAASRRSARARTCGRAPACRRTRSQSTGCRPRRPRPARPSFTNANAKTSTHDTAKNSVVSAISRLLTSIATSFRSTSQRGAEEHVSALRPARGTARAGPARAGSSASSRPSRTSATRVTRPSARSRSCVASTTIAPPAASARSRSRDDADRAIVEAGERLVEQHQPRPVQQRALERQPLPHAAREAADRVVGAIGEAGRLERRRRPAPRGSRP